jgi:pimeloyl-ACP methyl ester carboxylesterase
MLYWCNAAATSSARLYWESFGRYRPKSIQVPTGVAAFPDEILPTPREWVEPIYTDIRRWTHMPRGGHFAALEQPELFVDDVRAFFALLRT